MTGFTPRRDRREPRAAAPPEHDPTRPVDARVFTAAEASDRVRARLIEALRAARRYGGGG